MSLARLRLLVKLTGICLLPVAVGGCDTVSNALTNTVEAPLVAADHLFYGQSNKAEEKKLRNRNSKLSRRNSQLEEDIGDLRSDNRELQQQADAFDSLIDGFKQNECFRVDQRSRFEVLIQPRRSPGCF
jgi:predicted RNase H-like nuclease (RuvC/YqgF family)